MITAMESINPKIKINKHFKHSILPDQYKDCLFIEKENIALSPNVDSEKSIVVIHS